jgi:hypothetical protein
MMRVPLATTSYIGLFTAFPRVWVISHRCKHSLWNQTWMLWGHVSWFHNYLGRCLFDDPKWTSERAAMLGKSSQSEHIILA